MGGLGFFILILLLCVLIYAVWNIISPKEESNDVFWGIKVVQNKYIAVPLEQYICNYEEYGYITIFKSEIRAKEYCQIMNFEV